MSIYKFLAWTSPGLQKVLIEELAQYNISAKRSRLPIYPSSAVFFETSMENLNNIMYKPTCITYLNIRINKPIQARNAREFIRNMQKVQVHPYIPINAHLEIRLSIKRCLRNHSDNWRDVIKNYLLNNNKTRKLLSERKQLLLGKEEQPENYISETYSPKIPIPVNAYLYQNYLTMYVQLHFESLHKFGFKKYIGKATLSENIADALLHYCDMRRGVTLWDPFCGTGTIILTMLVRKFNKSIRKGMFLPLYQMPIFKDTYVDEELNELDINILANDINEQQLRIFYKNLDWFKNLKRIIRQQSPQLRSKSYENLSIAQLDFTSMHKEFIKDKLKKDDLIVITNPPWGRTVNLEKFNKMIKFLEINCSQCYLLIASDQFQFFNKRKWELLAEPLVGGQWTKIIKYDRNREVQLATSEIVLKENNQIISQTATTELIAKELSYQRDIEEYQNKKIVDLTKNLGALSKKLNNEDYLKHLKKETRTIADKHAVFLKKLNIGTKTKVRSIMLRRAQDLYKTKIRNLNLQINKIREQIKKERIELKKQEVKDKVILDKYQLKQEDLEKVQKVLDEKAKKKSLKLLKQEKKRSQTIPRW
ncbi:unnamed protein product [Paramecium sonneborni]|uniref:Ribosomal RNA large subunit methyltransferase K/L-like methyltransferase domain-containing protein n=1 Tax=Paramecium sonneborni TaxID=65129 RepID=A0A8S1QY89_9CILI|nr:unnamed protein product [Paramecium sonneborni]